MSFPVFSDDPGHVPAFRQCRGFGLSPVNDPRRMAGECKLHLREEGPASTGFYLFVSNRWKFSLAEDPHLSHSTPTNTTIPHFPAIWAPPGCWTQLFHPLPSFNISESLDDREGRSQTWSFSHSGLSSCLEGVLQSPDWELNLLQTGTTGDVLGLAKWVGTKATLE